MTARGPKRRSLETFASDNPRNKVGFTAWIETIPEFAEVAAGWQAGLTQSQILMWLRDECGYPHNVATPARVAHLSKQYPRSKRARQA